MAYEGIQSLDVTGPVEVFDKAGGYRIEVVSPAGYAVTTTSGLRLGVDGSLEAVRGPIDTLVVAGGDGVRHAVADVGVVTEVGRLAGRARRVTSVCSGAFLLAETACSTGGGPPPTGRGAMRSPSSTRPSSPAHPRAAG